MEQLNKEQLIKSVNAIKMKLKQMRDNEDITDLTMNRVLKPVAEPLKALLDVGFSRQNKDENKLEPLDNHNSSDSIYEDVEEKEEDGNNFDEIKFSSPLKDHYRVNEAKDIEKPLERSLDKDDFEDIYENINVPFGVRTENKQFLMGNEKVRILASDNSLHKKHVIIINDKQYHLTPGLKELLLRKTPDLSLVLPKDQLVYKNILDITNAHKRYYNSNEQIKGDKSIKYREIIRPLFLNTVNNACLSEIEDIKTGNGLPILKKYKTDTDLVYWDDPNELIERLKILIASRDAGNSNHDNEILSIIEELKEAGIIKE